MADEKKMIRATTVRYEAVARILSNIRDNLDELAPDLEVLVITHLANNPDATFEELVTLILQNRDTSRAIFDALA